MAQEIIDTLPALARRLEDVREYQIPRLAQATTMARDLASEARTDLESVRVGLEDARETAELAGGRREELLSQVSALEDEWSSVHRAYRSALVESKRRQDESNQRYELDESRLAEPEESSGIVGGDDALQTKTNEVTDALRRTTQLMQAELERSVLSVQMLDSSTETLRSTQSLYDRYNDLLTASGRIVKALEKADWWDRALIAAAFAFFLLCVAYVIKRRVLDRVGGLAAWWVGGSFRLLRMGLTGRPARKAVSDVVVSQGSGVATAAAVAGAAGAAAGAVKQELDKQKAPPDEEVQVKTEVETEAITIIDKVIPSEKVGDSKVGGVKLEASPDEEVQVKTEVETEAITIIDEVIPSEKVGDSKVGGVKVEL